MLLTSNNAHKIIIQGIGLLLLVAGIFLFIVPPALFPDPAMGFQVLRSMHLGSGFNVFNSPDQSDISQNYDEYLTWWSPGQYLVPYLFKTITNTNLGQAIAITVTLCQVSGLIGVYAFFKKIGFTSLISAISLLFIICQQAFTVPYVYYNGGEILLFAFEGWFLYGCISIKKTDWFFVLFIVISGWVGFFFKSSFLWIYAAGLYCLWITIASKQPEIRERIRKAFQIAIPAVLSLAVIYIVYISRGQSPASAKNGLKLTLQTFLFPIASPILSGFSVDDLFHGLLYHTGKVILNPQWSIVLLILIGMLSLLMIWGIARYIPNKNYKVFVLIFYVGSILFFGSSYLRQLNISMEARHFRIIGILVTPGLVYFVSRLKLPYLLSFMLIPIALMGINVNYFIKGYSFNKNESAVGITGLSQHNIDQPSLNYLLKLDCKHNKAIFVFLSDDTGLEILHNRTIMLPPIANDLKIDEDDYRYEGHAGPLYIVLPESYNGPREKMIMKSFPGYKGFNVSMLSDNYVLYSAK